MHRTGRYLYVAFMCQQAIEKLLKGIIHERKNTTPPYSHRLVALLEMADTGPQSKDRLDFLDRLTTYYINTRYPDDKKKLAASLNKAKVKGILRETKECFQWLQKESGT